MRTRCLRFWNSLMTWDSCLLRWPAPDSRITGRRPCGFSALAAAAGWGPVTETHPLVQQADRPIGSSYQFSKCFAHPAGVPCNYYLIPSSACASRELLPRVPKRAKYPRADPVQRYERSLFALGGARMTHPQEFTSLATASRRHFCKESKQ